MKRQTKMEMWPRASMVAQRLSASWNVRQNEVSPDRKTVLNALAASSTSLSLLFSFFSRPRGLM